MENEESTESPLRGRFCPMPFRNLIVNTGGQVHFCYPGWNSFSIGKLHREKIRDIWSSPEATHLRKSVLDGTFKYCSKAVCPLIKNGELPSLTEIEGQDFETLHGEMPGTVVLCYDQSCNLTCPSCRKEKIDHREGSPEFNAATYLTERLLAEFFNEPNDRPLVLNITGSGDPFASSVFRKLMETIDGVNFPNLKIDLQTNGTLLTPVMWQKISKIHGNLRRVQVSIDAATPSTYTELRKGGSWDQLMKNITFLADLRRHDQVSEIVANMVVQKRNFREIPDFIEKFLTAGFDFIFLPQLQNWGTWNSSSNPTSETYEDQCIWNSSHPLNHEFLDVLDHPALTDARVFGPAKGSRGGGSGIRTMDLLLKEI